jgi:2-dehydropantoate 2-reductase
VIDAKVLVVGGGAIGGATAGMLAGNVSTVCVLDANAEHVARMREPGLRLDIVGQEHTIPLDAYTDPAQLPGPFDFGICALKSIAIEPALTPLAEANIADAWLSLGNGLVQDRIGAIVGEDRLLVGTVEFGGTNHGPGHLAKTSHSPYVIGEPDGTDSERLQRLKAILETAEPVIVSHNVQAQIWSKLLVNSTFSGLAVVGGLLYGEIAAHPVGRPLAIALWREGHRVGKAQGLELEEVLTVHPDALTRDDEETERAVDQMIGQAVMVKASMLQDVEKGIPCEVDVINGGVVKRGAEHGVPTPLNAEIVEIVHGFERGEGRPHTDHFARLAALM